MGPAGQNGLEQGEIAGCHKRAPHPQRRGGKLQERHRGQFVQRVWTGVQQGFLFLQSKGHLSKHMTARLWGQEKVHYAALPRDCSGTGEQDVLWGKRNFMAHYPHVVLFAALITAWHWGAFCTPTGFPLSIASKH
eukprot:scaffold165002_cov16-Tisochrysis_lutea.AAC.1